MKSTPHRGSKLKAKIRRFNTSVLERHTTADIAQDRFTMQGMKLPYKEGRVRADSLHRQASVLALVNSILTVFVIVCAFFENEAGYYGDFDELQLASLRTVILTASLVQIMLTLQGAHKQLNMLKVLGQVHPDSKGYAASLICDLRRAVPLCCEIIHLCIVMPPLVDYSTYQEAPGSVSFRVSIGDFVTCAIVFRLYHVVRYVYSQSRYFLPKAQFYT